MSDTTPPVLVSAAISGSGYQLVLSYADASDLRLFTGWVTYFSGAGTAAPKDFVVVSGGSANAVTLVTVSPNAKTVTLALTRAVTSDLAVTVAYTDPTSGDDDNATQDTAGNDAASFAATTVTNNSTLAPSPAPDTTPPVFVSGAVNTAGNQLVLTYADASELKVLTGSGAFFGTGTAALRDFAVVSAGSANAVTAVTVNPSAKTVTLTLIREVTSGQAVTVAYTDPTSGNDYDATQDTAGNDAASFAATSVTNNSTLPALGTTPPVFRYAVVSDSGYELVLNYTDLDNLDAVNVAAASAFAVVSGGAANPVTLVVVDAARKTVTLSLSTPVKSGQTVTLAYTDPSGGDDTEATQDLAGHDAKSLAATPVANNSSVSSTADVTPPVLVSATVTGSQLVLAFTDASELRTTIPLGTIFSMSGTGSPASSDFAVVSGGNANLVTVVVVNPSAKTVTLTLTTAVTQGQAVTVAYADPTAGNDFNAIQDRAGNDAASFAATSAANNTSPPTLTATGTTVQAQPGAPLTSGGNGSDVLLGAPGNNRFFGGLGDDSITGSTGIDTAVFAGNRSSYTITTGSQGTTVTAPSSSSALAGAGEGTDRLTNVERLTFADGSKAFDFTGSALFTAELLGVVLGPNSLQNRALVGNFISYFDQGRTLAQAAELLTTGGVMAALAGGSDNTSFVTYLFRTLVGSQPSAGTTSALAGLLDSGALTQAQFLVKAAELPINLANVNLVGLQTTGLDFLPL